MYLKGEYIELKTALKDLLRENRITLDDILSAMDEEKQGLMDALNQRVTLEEEECRLLEKSLTSKVLNLLLFVIQTFYITNPSGTYKGQVIYPVRDEVVLGMKATMEGLKRVGRALGVHVDI